MTENTDKPARRRLELDPEELRGAAEIIINSGALGRSRIYGNLLSYLVDSTIAGQSPKEIEIAIEVLGRDTDFDVSRDSAVRVYVHQLRKRLEQYYESHAPQAPWRLSIPKGQYTLEVLAVEAGEAAPADAAESAAGQAEDTNDHSTPAEQRPELLPLPIEIPKTRAHRKWPYLLILLLASCNLTLLFLLIQAEDKPAAAEHPLWEAVLTDELPILVVMGDYYIFGELDDAGNVKRMIRDFDINSAEDLESLFAARPDLGWQYYDLNLSYLPEGSALALNYVLPLIHSVNKPVRIKMMSELTTRDLHDNHVIYLGYVSALGPLGNLLFPISNLRLGENFDQLIERQSGTVHTSDAGMPSYNEPFTDYGWFATFPSTRATQIIIIAGMRDAGLIQAAKAMSDSSALAGVEAEFESLESAQLGVPSFELLYEVRGLDRTSFNARLVFGERLDASRIWSGNSVLPAP